MESKEPLNLSLGTLINMLASGGNLVPATLARCRGLPAIRTYAAQIGLCRPGEFTHHTAMAIRDMLCVERAIDQRAASAEMVSSLLPFLMEKATTPSPPSTPDAGAVQAGAGPTDPARTNSQLNDQESNIVTALKEGTMTGEKLARKAGYPFNSNLRTTLSNLKKRGIINNRGNGYFLPPSQ